ncbi:MAG: ABC transporter substrate-binding protein [Syntrophobacteraceae bacterium]|nr:ABC transporter substrate-binding protein [Desulfobacteraceae bacterium]
MQLKTCVRVVCFCFAVLAAFTESAALAAPAPLAVVREGTDQALKILRETQSSTGLPLRQRKDEILTIVNRYFNFDEMARRALGRPWKDQSPDKQKEFVRLFRDLLFNTYVDRVQSYTGTNEKIVYDNERIEGDYALVKTRIRGFKDTDVQVDYRLRQEKGEWKVYDVIVEGVSFIDNYRGQFNSILANESFDSLLRRLSEKVAAQKNP